MTRIISSFIAFFTIASLSAGGNYSGTPKLIVGITIDQLRGDYLELFSRTFGEKGFKRLINKGLVYSDTKYDFPNSDRASSVATIYTGANPSFHGIVGENKYISSENREISSYFDKNYMGNYTNESVSPLPLKVSTIADELKIASVGQSDVFAFAPYFSEALASGGHAANGAYWIEDTSGKWATSTFYKNNQPVVDQFNRSNQSFCNRIGTLIWRPANDIKRYNAFPYTRNYYNFQHGFVTDKKANLKLFKQSPYVNGEIREIAEKVLKNNRLGGRSNPDFLALTFYAGNYDNALDKNYSIEIQDTYFRLDQEIAKLLDAIDASVGLNNALIFVVSTGYFDEQEIIPQGIKTSAGEFYPDKTISLLNMYLMAIFGREQWVTKYYNRQLFFNRKLIEDKKINFVDMQDKAARFLADAAGVHDVITSHQVLHGAYNQTAQFYRNSFYKGISGDLFLEIEPGWRIVEKKDEIKQNRERNNSIRTPLIFFGNNIKPQKIDRVVDATQIAPSVCYRLRIRSPNASQASVLDELQ